MDEIIIQMGNYLTVTAKEPDTLIINDALFTKYLLKISKYILIDVDEESNDFRMYGLKVVRTHDIKGFKVARLDI